MKQFFTFLFSLLFSAAAFAQLPAGATAPDFTAKDLNGRSWNLYEILESGRPVVMDVSATWCGPCWSYHNSGALEGFYALYGPEGEGNAMVFMVEGDASTNTACLYGPSGCNDATQGDWVTNTPYPIFDNSSISNAYDVSYFPTVYLICPDKKVTEVGQDNTVQLWNQASVCVGQVPAHYAKIRSMTTNSRSLEICTPQTARPLLRMVNLGTEVIQEALVHLRWNGQLIQSKGISGSEIHVFDAFEVQFDSLTIAEPGALTAEVVSINGAANGIPAVVTANYVAAAPTYSVNEIAFQLRTDGQAKDIFYAFFDADGNIIAQGGNVLVGPFGGGAFPDGAPSDPSALANSTWVRDTFVVPSTGCFSFRLVDASGNGMNLPGQVKLFEKGQTQPFLSVLGNQFTSEIGKTYASELSGIKSPEYLPTWTINPNPATDLLNISVELPKTQDIQLLLRNIAGRLVWSQTFEQQVAGPLALSIPVNQLPSGIYQMTLQAEAGVITRKVLVSK